jgi:hypothetical protein
VRSILRAILTIVLLLGGGAGDWAPANAQTHESCCCGTPAGGEDRCPCPKPEGNRAPSRSLCTERAASVASLAVRRIQVRRRVEPRPEPATWAKTSADPTSIESFPHAQGRDPDLGRHLARLSEFRI